MFRVWLVASLFFSSMAMAKPLHKEFEVLPYRDGLGSIWGSSTTHAPDSEITVVVGATWCGATARLLKHLRSNPSQQLKVDMIVFAEDELEHMLRLDVARGRLTSQQARALAAQAGGVLVNKEVVEGLGKIYLVRRAWFDAATDSYPTVLRCNVSGCRRSKAARQALYD